MAPMPNTISRLRFRPFDALLLGAVALIGLASGPARAEQDFGACLESMRADATAKGVSAATFDAQLRGLSPDRTVLDLQQEQPEFKTPIWDYLAALVDDQRIADGRAMLAQWRSTLDAVEARFGVDRHVVVAVWGVESDFGKSIGKRPLIQSLATLACYGEKASYFRHELITTLKIIDDGNVNPAHLVGSWAGAFGHTQFMPSTFMRLAVDMDGSGNRDIVDSVPNALGSTANFLRKSGWSTGESWGFEVVLPDGYRGPTGRGAKRPFSAWAAAGVRRADGRALPAAGTAGLIVPAGRDGPAFLVTHNFDAIYSYNAAESYALAISLLSDRLKGAGPLVGTWPTNDRGLSRAERKEVQALLTQRGYDVGTPDGAVGAKTHEAIKAYEARLGLPPTGRPGGVVLDALRAGR
ncbi:MAG: lytic murein transglycosylase [Hyphomicrobiales bacterium]|nr:lytic murein transglycosylase [Hyphomicrobiales bacterium]MBV9755219.1 lytic murein transglycosylase [Hyphomicrobiales bacterium]